MYGSISSLKATSVSGSTGGEYRVVMGYYSPNDGGGGVFRYNAGSSAMDNGGTIIAPNTGGGRWERVLPQGREIRVEWFGAKGDGTTNDSTAIQAAIDYVRLNGGGRVLLDSKTYIADGLLLKSTVEVIGEGARATTIKPPSGSSNGFVFGIPTGPVINVKLKGVGLYENGNAGQHGIYLNAVSQGPPDNNGGLWYATFEDLYITQFAGHNIWCRAGHTGLVPHQFISWRNIYSVRACNTTSRALKLTGQCGQMDFYQCELDGVRGAGTGTNVEIGTGGEGNMQPYTISFNTCTLQNTDKAAVIGNGTGNGCIEINFNDCYFENVYHALDFQGPVYGSTVKNCVFANAASDGSGTGYAAQYDYYSFGTFDSNFMYGSYDRAVVLVGGNGATSRVDVRNTIFGLNGNKQVTTEFSGFSRQVGVNGDGSIGPMGLAKAWIVTTSATNITTIKSSLPPDSTLYLRAWTGTIKFATGGNIDLAGRTSPYTLASGAMATFVRMDLGGTWVLAAVSV